MKSPSNNLFLFLQILLLVVLNSCKTTKIIEIKEDEKIERELEYKFINSVHGTDICLIFDKSLINENITITQNRDKIIVMEKTMINRDFEKDYTYLFLGYGSSGSIIYFGKFHYFIPSDIYQKYRFLEIFKKEGSKKIFIKFSNKNKYNINLNVFPDAPKYSEDLEW